MKRTLIALSAASLLPIAGLLVSCLPKLPPPDEPLDPPTDDPVTMEFQVDTTGTLDEGAPEECRFELTAELDDFGLTGLSLSLIDLDVITLQLVAPRRDGLGAVEVELQSPSMNSAQWESVQVEFVPIDEETSMVGVTLTASDSPLLFNSVDPIGTWVLRISDANADACAEVTAELNLEGSWEAQP